MNGAPRTDVNANGDLGCYSRWSRRCPNLVGARSKRWALEASQRSDEMKSACHRCSNFGNRFFTAFLIPAYDQCMNA
jgi:hypothetical protein